MYVAVAQMSRGGVSWKVTIGHYDKFEDAERDARRFAARYDFCDWVQVLDDLEEAV